MPQNVPTQWTESRVNETVDAQYINSHLRLDEQHLLTQAPSFGAGLTDDTYLDWILTRAKRFFLILVDAGVPDQIFGIVDDSYDDDDLPIAEDVVQDLRLSYDPNRSLNKRFYKTQFRYLSRVVEEAEHIRYAQEEMVPVYPLGIKSTVLALGKDGTDRVRLPSDLTRAYTRKRIALDNHTTEHAVLVEIAAAKKYANEHLISVYGSYLFEESVYLLLTPAAEYNLKSFLSDTPKSFESLPKHQRREILINWPHCLANALSWLHVHGRPHASIKPSSVIIDDKFKICFGSFEGAGLLKVGTKVDDIESYQYAAPERWKRAITVQTSGPSRVSGHSGGRTAHKVKTSKSTPGTESKRSSWTYDVKLDFATPVNTGYSFMPTAKNNFSRLQLGASTSDSVVSLESERSTHTRQSNRSDGTVRPSSGRGLRSDTPSASSQATGSSGSNRNLKAALQNSIYVAAPEVRTAVVQTWQSAQYDLFAADVFSLGAVILGILTLLCKRTAGSFERHRSSKNRTAGRGGGLADASFHANIGQVMIWADILNEDAKKKAKKADGHVFKAVGPILQLTKRCLERDSEERLSAKELEKRLVYHISMSSNISAIHCKRELNSDASSPTRERSTSTPRPKGAPSDDSQGFSGDPNLSRAQREDQWSRLRAKGLVTATIPTPGPESSLSSLSSFNFDYDVTSDTAVEDDRSHVTTEASESQSSRSVPAAAHELAKRLKPKSKGRGNWNNWHNNDSEVDPRLSQSPNSVQKGFNYMGYSSSTSSEEEVNPQMSFLFPESRPSSMVPDMPLPPLPPLPPKDKVRPNRLDAFPDVPRGRVDSGSRSRRLVQERDAGYVPRTPSLQHLQQAGSRTTLDEAQA